jgi:hypothetical protein
MEIQNIQAYLGLRIVCPEGWLLRGALRLQLVLVPALLLLPLLSRYCAPSCEAHPQSTSSLPHLHKIV